MKTMSENNNTRREVTGNDTYAILYKKYTSLKDAAWKLGLKHDDLRHILLRDERQKQEPKQHEPKLVKSKVGSWKMLILFAVVALVALIGNQWVGTIFHAFLVERCLVSNGFTVMEISRPLADCRICQGVHGPMVLENVTRESFAPFAYSGRPVLAKGAATSWNATHIFSYEFFRELYMRVEGALESVEEECQFFPFRSEFNSLADAFSMSSDAALGRSTDKPWYIGWSNCHPRVAKILRQHYSRPHFLPIDSEASTIDWIFMGWSGQGASIHLDYVQRPSWQAQITGRKKWKLLPVPECEAVCSNLEVIVEKGDIVFIDTNQWYHDTFIESGEISITIGSEYD